MDRNLLPGRRYGKLHVHADATDDLVAVCDCGKGVWSLPTAIYQGEQISCGCAKGKERSLLYAVLVDGFIKIGYTTNFRYRLVALTSGSPCDVILLCLLTHASPEKEKRIHKLLRDFRTHLEWFEADDLLLDTIMSADDTDDLIVKIGEMHNKILDDLIGE